MLSRFSVKYPFVVVVAVIVSLILGGVSLTKMKTDLFPEMQVPYLAVITTDPGSTAEKIEVEVTNVLEGSLATVNGVASITSQSSDNFSLIFIEFEDGTNMDSALVKVSSAVNEVAPQLPDSVGTPNYMEISTDLAATMYVAASNDDMDVFELSDFVEGTLVSEFERIDGVADVSVSGAVEQSVEVRISDAKVDAVNARLADYVYSQFAGAQADIDAQYAWLDSAGGRAYYPYEYAELDAYQAAIDEQRNAALDAASIGALANKDTIAQLVNAQNFSMPAGYIDDATDTQWLLRVGENFVSVEELGNLVLATVDGIGDVRLSDVADITVIDNVGDSYVRVNESDALLLSIFKTSTASTSDISKACEARITQLEEDHDGLELTIVMDQGDYIDLFISSIMNSLIIGAALAVVVLAVFLRDLKPTAIIAFSIPFSVLFALILMHFTGITLNVLTLGGIALAIGMLVDNSIIVLENIYRLRGRGVSAPRAAVQGAKQISGAVVASTLTTICVFLPAIFTTGLVSQMLVPFALTVTYVLVASLIVALTLVPSVAAFMFKTHRPRNEGWFERVQNSYASSLSFFLRHKLMPLTISIALLVFSVAGVLNMGVTLMPSMTNKTLNVTVALPENTLKADGYALANQIMEIALDLDGVESVTAFDGTTTLSMMTSAADSSASETVGSFSFFIQTDDSVTTEQQVFDIAADLEKRTRKLDCTVMTSASSSDEMMSMLGTGLTITLKGPNQDVLLEMSEDIMAIVDGVEGYTEISNGLEEAADELHLVFDRNTLARQGITAAQVYMAISDKLSTSVDATVMTLDKASIQITVIDETASVTKENVLALEVEVAGTTVRVGDVATASEGKAAQTITHIDSQRTMDVTAEVEDGENNALLSRELSKELEDYDVPEGYTVEYSGELMNVNTMLEQMGLMALLGFVLIYLIMVAQFQGLLSPFIVILTVPLAFTGGFLGLLIMGEQLTILSLMGFLVLMGTIVNNGIVFVDYVNQLRRGGLEKRDALVEAGRTRMRPILMTALTTILSMLPLMFSEAVGGSMQRGMATVVVGGMIYATFMTLYVVPIMYDMLYRRVPLEVDLGSDDIDEDPGDAAVYLEKLAAERARTQAEAAAAVAQQPVSLHAVPQIPARVGNEPPEPPEPRW